MRRREIRTVNLSEISLRSYAGGVLITGAIVSEDSFLFDGETTKKAEFKWVDGFTVDVLLKGGIHFTLDQIARCRLSDTMADTTMSKSTISLTTSIHRLKKFLMSQY